MEYDMIIYFWYFSNFFNIYFPICFICEATLGILKGVLHKIYYYYYNIKKVWRSVGLIKKKKILEKNQKL